MGEVRIEVETEKSIKECATVFQEAVHSSYGAGRRVLRGLAAIRGTGDTAGLEFFTPGEGHGPPADLSLGAHVPGFNKLRGAMRMTVHCYVVDHGRSRRVVVVGPHSVGERGSTERLIKTVANAF